MGFDPCERSEHFVDRAVPTRFDVQAEQRHATDTGTLPNVVIDELALMDRADVLVLQYPMWWHLPPAMLKGWFDRVLAYGEAYTSKKRFEKGRFVGKRAMLSVTVGTSRSTYEYDGRSGDIDLMLWPVHRESHSIGRPKGRPYLGIFALLICLEPRDRISFDPFPRLGFAVETAICLFATGECDANIPAWLGRGVAWPRVNTPPMTERSTHRIFSAAPQPRGGP
jgi:putative NADPH-quinone reductase